MYTEQIEVVLYQIKDGLDGKHVQIYLASGNILAGYIWSELKDGLVRLEMNKRSIWISPNSILAIMGEAK